MKSPLENFKFATIENVSVKVSERENKVEVKIEPLDKTKEIEINYEPLDHYSKGDFMLTDNHKEITIERSYPIATLDDVDWDCEEIYPCQRCTNQRTYQDELRKENTELRKILKDIINLMN